MGAGAPTSAQRLDPNVPANVFARPTGPYLVGTFDTLWIDARRPERYTKDPNDQRHLLVQIWYPADTLPGVQRSRYIRTPAEFGSASAFKAVEHVITNSLSSAPFRSGRDKFPILIYNHGAGWSRFTGTFITELLASHGYVVFSIDHPGRNRSVLFPDGVAFRADTVPGNPPAQDPNGDPRALSWRCSDT
jgi:predicted dienelactone hydrolase